MRALSIALLLAAGCAVDVMKTIVVAPLGLHNQPNEYGQYPAGALSVADNVAMRDPGKLSSMPNHSTFRSSVLPANSTPRRLWIGDSDQQLLIGEQGGNWHARWLNSGASSTITFPFTLSISTGIAPVATQRSRVIAGTASGPVVMDSESDTSARVAGFGRPFVYSISLTTTAAPAATGALPNSMQTRYVACIRRKHSDGYETNGPFSTPMRVLNQSGSDWIHVTIRVALETNTAVAAGDIVELYRTKNTAAAVDPGSTFYLVKAQTVTSTDVTNRYINIVDRVVSNDDLGLEASTNPGKDGPLKDKTPPPIARDIVVHNGHTLYLGTTTPATLVAYIGGTMTGGVGSSALTSAQRAAGIGYRTFTADQTDGSPILTNISAANIVGLDVGQYVEGTGAPGYITAVGATTITLDTNAVGTAAGGSYESSDRITLSGARVSARSYYELSTNVGHPTGAGTGNSPFAFLASEQSEVAVGSSISGTTISIARQFPHEGSFTIQASNGGNYSPPIATYSESAQTVATEQKLNRVHWAESEQPEAVPLLNTFLVGSGEIYRGVSVGGVVLVFASDGLWQVTGDGANGWSVQNIDPEISLATRGSVCVMNERAYAYTNRGLVEISPDGAVRELSEGRCGDFATGLRGDRFSNSWDTYVVADEKNREILVTLSGGDGFFVYSTRTDAFTTYTPTDDIGAAAFGRFRNTMMLARVADVLQVNSESSNGTLAADARFHPLTLDNPSTQKEWQEVEYRFEGITGGTATLTPSFSGTSYTARTVPANDDKSKIIVPVPRNAPAIAPELEPGFEVAAFTTSPKWSLTMMAVSVVPATEEGQPR